MKRLFLTAALVLSAATASADASIQNTCRSAGSIAMLAYIRAAQGHPMSDTLGMVLELNYESRGIMLAEAQLGMIMGSYDANASRPDGHFIDEMFLERIRDAATRLCINQPWDFMPGYFRY